MKEPERRQQVWQELKALQEWEEKQKPNHRWTEQSKR